MVRRVDGVYTYISLISAPEFSFSDNPRQKNTLDDIVWFKRKMRVIYRLDVIFSMTHVVQLMVPKIDLFCQRDVLS